MTTTTSGTRKRVVSGMRPTGRLHIGHYFGALQNWVRLQNEVAPPAVGDRPVSSDSPLATRHSPLSSYDCFYFIADWHALTSDYADTSAVAQNTIEIMTDYLASGLDPEKSTLFLQSLVPEHAELHVLLSMVTPLGWLERVPTYKEALDNVKDKDLHNYGFLGYPVLQCADITIYSEGAAQLFVPTGEDQVSHVETSREIVRRFNGFFGFELDRAIFDPKNEKFLRTLYDQAPSQLVEKEAWGGRKFLEHFQSVFNQVRFEGVLKQMATGAGYENFLDGLGEPARFFSFHKSLIEPESMVTSTPRVPGLDGRKMSKSYGNTIMLSESDEDIRKKTKVMVTDPARKRRSDPGNPDVCPVYDWHKLFAPKNAAGEYTSEGKVTLEWSATGCRTAGIGCIECKAAMAENLIKWITPVRDRRVEYEKHPARVLEFLDEGSRKARIEAQKTMERVREAVFGWEKKIGEVKSGTTQVHGTHT